MPLLHRQLWFALFALTLVLQACATLTNPIETAKTAEQKAFASYGIFVVMEEQAAVLMQNPSIPNDAKIAIQKADALAKPAADSLLNAALEVISVRKQFQAAQTTEEKLQLAIDNLDGWIITARPLINDLVSAVEGN
ncbi:MAG: hypothetical protein ACR2PR_06015 [Pseudohongiellaceae bacterium]